MNKKRLLTVGCLAIVLLSFSINGMEEEESPDLLAKVPFFERIQVDGLRSSDGQFEASCYYNTSMQRNHFVEQKELEKYARWGFYPWGCHITIFCMTAEGKKEIGKMVAINTILHKMEWLEGHQLRILTATLTRDMDQLRWVDGVYALDGTLLQDGMLERLRTLYARAFTIQQAQ